MIGNDWDNLLKEEYKKPYFQRLAKIVKDAYRERLFIRLITICLMP